MTLRYENKKEFYGYSRETMLIFSDNELEEINIQLLQEILSLYRGNSGEVVDVRIIYDEIKGTYLILVIIICFKTLLETITKKEYSNFIKMHKIRFVEYYIKIIGDLT